MEEEKQSMSNQEKVNELLVALFNRAELEKDVLIQEHADTSIEIEFKLKLPASGQKLLIESYKKTTIDNDVRQKVIELWNTLEAMHDEWKVCVNYQNKYMDQIRGI